MGTGVALPGQHFPMAWWWGHKGKGPHCQGSLNLHCLGPSPHNLFELCSFLKSFPATLSSWLFLRHTQLLPNEDTRQDLDSKCSSSGSAWDWSPHSLVSSSCSPKSSTHNPSLGVELYPPKIRVVEAFTPHPTPGTYNMTLRGNRVLADVIGLVQPPVARGWNQLEQKHGGGDIQRRGKLPKTDRKKGTHEMVIVGPPAPNG